MRCTADPEDYFSSPDGIRVRGLYYFCTINFHEQFIICLAQLNVVIYSALDILFICCHQRLHTRFRIFTNKGPRFVVRGIMKRKHIHGYILEQILHISIISFGQFQMIIFRVMGQKLDNSTVAGRNVITS